MVTSRSQQSRHAQPIANTLHNVSLCGALSLNAPDRGALASTHAASHAPGVAWGTLEPQPVRDDPSSSGDNASSQRQDSIITKVFPFCGRTLVGAKNLASPRSAKVSMVTRSGFITVIHLGNVILPGRDCLLAMFFRQWK